jgi:glycosyltransferase involved in cell wall biosynthesis
MNVLFIPSRDEYYGATESFCSIVMALSENYNITPILLLSRYGRLSKFAEKNGYEYYVIGHRAFLVTEGSTVLRRLVKKSIKVFYYLRYHVANRKAIKLAERKVDFSKIDLIYSNHNRDDIGAILARRNHKKHIWHIREFSDKDFKCMTLRNDYIKFMNWQNNYFVAVSDAVMDWWVEKGIEKKRITRIYNGIDSTKFYKNGDKKKSDKIRIIMTGSLDPTKRQDFLLRALSMLPEETKSKIVVDIYGDGAFEYKMRLGNIVRKGALESIVSFKGYSSSIQDILYNYDIGIMASKAEAFGRVTAEYMMAGLAVLAANTGANPELIDDGRTGFLFDCASENSLMNNIEFLVENRNEIEIVARNARNEALQRFSLANCTDQLYSLFEAVV